MCNWEKVCRGCWYGFVNLIERRREVSVGGYHTCLIWFCLVVSEIGGEEFKRLCQAIFVAYQMGFVHAREMFCMLSTKVRRNNSIKVCESWVCRFQAGFSVK